MADIDSIRNDDGACVDDAQAALQSIADYALECKSELHCDDTVESVSVPPAVAGGDTKS